ncbi:DUF397 domain-containing protein [Streptomyces sp. NPDC047042]|uniref:DUF397 domain-containing protein n=1 Tax=Streptomyces sp. NPDC047042 TaxID=3154807 RepID=UPI0033D371DC
MTQDRRPLRDLTEAVWRVSSYSGGQGECVEIADNLPYLVPVRDSKWRATAPAITFGRDAWCAFVAQLG